MAGRHESSKVRAVVTTTRRSPLARWPPQLAASQISAATRIATKNTTTMTAAGIVRSLSSCLCTSVPVAVDGVRARRGGQARSRCAGGFSCPGQCLQLPNLRLSDPALRPEPSGERSPATPPVRPVVPREAGWVLVSGACCPARPLVVGSGRPRHATLARRRRGSSAVSQGGRPAGTARAARSHRGSAGPDRMPRRRLAGRHTTRRRAGRRAAGFAVPEPPGRPGRPG